MPSCYDPQIRGGPWGGGLPLYFIALIQIFYLLKEAS